MYDIVLGVLALIGVLYYYFTRNFNYWKDRNVPGPEPVPFFGNLMKSALRQVSAGVIYKEIYDSYPNEKLVGIYKMTSPALLVRDPEILKYIMIKDFDNFVDRGIQICRQGLGKNLFHTDGDTWRALRSRFSPIFTNQKLKNMMHLLKDRGDKLVNYLHEITAVKPEHDIHRLVQKYTMSTITACAFGLDVDTFHGEVEILKTIDDDIFSPRFGLEIDMMYPGILLKLNMDLFPRYARKYFKNIVKSVIADRSGVPSARRDFMDLILEIRNKKQLETNKLSEGEMSKTIEITDSVIEAQAFIFYAAGYETAASTMGYMLYQLALNPKIQDRLRNEIDEYLKRHDGRIEVDTFGELTYLEQCFKETLRLYPIADNLQRRALNDYICPVTGTKVAKGQVLMVSVLGIHRDEKYYPEPEKFDPDRFLPENEAARHFCSYLPFGHGPRHCIGKRFAQAQSRVCLIKMISKFKVEAGKNTPRSFGYDPRRITLSPDNPLFLYIYPRKDL